MACSRVQMTMKTNSSTQFESCKQLLHVVFFRRIMYEQYTAYDINTAVESCATNSLNAENAVSVTKRTAARNKKK